jgi:hypothetical protein
VSADFTQARRRPSASVPAPLRMLLQIHRHLGGKALARPTFLVEKREPDLVRVERLEGLDFEEPA